MPPTDFTPRIRWTENETYAFVKLYLGHECLWNPSHEDYKNQNRRKDAYNQISSDFQSATHMILSEYDVRQKIKSLRSTYNCELIKLKQHEKRKPTLAWFSDYHKCLQHITKAMKNERYSARHKTIEVTEESEKLWDTEDVAESEEQTTEELEEPASEELDNNLSTSDTKDPINADENYIYFLKTEPGTEDPMSDMKRQKSLKSKKKKLKRLSTSSNCSEQTFRGSMDSNQPSREDEFDIYGKYVATQLREMSIKRALRVQLQIHSIVSEARLEAIKEMEL